MQIMDYAALQPGQRFTSPARTLTDADHGLFMMLVGDWHPIHADEDYARTTPFGRRLMHATFGVALAMGMQTGAMEFADPMVGAIGLTDWRFTAPMFVGDTVHVEIEIIRKRITSDQQRYIVERVLRLVKHDGTVLQVGTAAVMLRLNPAPPPHPGEDRDPEQAT
jgi:acyl dehydratase